MIELLVTSLALQGAVHVAASDWVTTGTDCTVFACADFDRDGFDDVLTVNGARQLCVAYSVRGEKAATWKVVRENVPEGVLGIAVIRTDWKSARELVLATRDKLWTWIFSAQTLEGDPHDASWRLGWKQPDGPPISSRSEGVLTMAEALALDGRLWVRTPEDEWMQLWTGASWFRGPSPDPRPLALAVSPPPYEPASAVGPKPLSLFHGDLNGDGLLDTLAVFAATLPYPHHAVRVALAPDARNLDLDSDGVKDDEESKLGTDPLDRDTDDDGLLDGWEVNGLPCALRELDAPLDPRHQDVIVFVSRYEQLEEVGTKKELERSKRLYAELANVNPDGTRGVRLHFVWGPVVAADRQGNWPDVGNRELPLDARGIMHWMQVTPGGGGQSSETSSMGGSGLHWAAFAHELGHQLSLSHTGDSEPAWCPFYPSIMNYAFNYGFDGDGEKIRFSDGKRRDFVLDERALHERMPVPFADVSYLAQGPFHFTIEARGERDTWIDWNHDGLESEGKVSADVNYGGSTYGGTRRDVGFTKSGPALALVGGKIVLAAADRESGLVTLRTYQGDERWSDPRSVPGSATDTEPVITGFGSSEGLLFVKQAQGWSSVRFDETALGVLQPPDANFGDDLSACALDGGVLVVSRAVDGALHTNFVESIPAPGSPMPRGAPQSATNHSSGTSGDSRTPSIAWTTSAPLDFTSGVPIGLAYDARTKQIVVAGSAPNAEAKERCFHVAWFTVDAQHALLKREERIVGGPHGVVHCTTRPVVRFTPAGQLVLFHTGWPDGNGSFTAWRTTPVANRALNDGWLVCLMYDIWTQSRVPVAFETDGKNAVYSYRWDASADRMNMLQVAHNGLGLDAAPMRDFDDAAKISRWGIRHSILNLHRP